MQQVHRRPVVSQLANPGILKLTHPADHAPEIVEELIDLFSPGKPPLRLSAVKALRTLSESEPDLLCPHFTFFEDSRRNENSVLRWNAMLILGKLASVDAGRRSDLMIDDYLAPIAWSASDRRGQH